jgi:hypothetical protein
MGGVSIEVSSELIMAIKIQSYPWRSLKKTLFPNCFRGKAAPLMCCWWADKKGAGQTHCVFGSSQHPALSASDLKTPNLLLDA